MSLWDALFGSQQHSWDLPAKYVNQESIAYEIVRLINENRRRYGREELTIAPELMAAAQLQADHMADRDRIGHDGPRGNDVIDRVGGFGTVWQHIGENVAGGGIKDAQMCVDCWMMSPSHRDAMLHSMFEEIGVGYACTGTQTRTPHYYAAVFGTRM